MGSMPPGPEGMISSHSMPTNVNVVNSISIHRNGEIKSRMPSRGRLDQNNSIFCQTLSEIFVKHGHNL